MGCIYLRTNKINGKCYVGQTKDIKIRNRKWKNLKTEYAGKVINNARAKYGVDGFSFELLKECPNEDMNYWEMYYIKIYNSKTPYGYNSTDGGDSGYEITEETRKKMSAAHRGKKLSPESIAKRTDAIRGMKRSEETKKKIAAAQRGKKRPAEVIAKIADALRGKKRPAEVVAKCAAAQTNHPKKSKAVQALDKDGNVVYEFPSAAEAQRQGYGSHSHISQCCNGKRKSHKGFIWRYSEK